MFIYFMYEATVIIVISLFERALLLLFGMRTSALYTTHSIWHFPWSEQFSYLIQLQCEGSFD